MSLVPALSTSRRALAAIALAIAALLAAVALSAATAPSAQAATCPSFSVLHNDRIGPAVLPAGKYTITTSASVGLSCTGASALFTRFLEDYDGNLPNPWTVVAQGSGKASFKKGGIVGFSVSLTGGSEEGGNNPSIGRLCPGNFTVNARTQVGGLIFNRGQYLIYLPPRTGIACNRASVLFTRFLGQPGGRLPAPWQLTTQTATFFKPEHPARSAFRIEPAYGS